MEETINIREFLLFGLRHFGIEVEESDEHHLKLEKEYSIEIEGPSLFKLIHQGHVVAPFADVEQLCEFISQDIKLNYG